MLTFVQCSSAHLPAVREFWAHVYPAHHLLGTDRALFAWQFGSAAGGSAAGGSGSDAGTRDEYHMKLALNDEQVVGCLGYIPVDVRVRGASLRGCWLANWIVAPEIARMGVGPLLLREVLREVDIVVNVGISDEARKLLLRMGWLDLGGLARWVRPLQAASADALLPADADGQWPEVPSAQAAAFKTSSNSASRFTLHEVRAFGANATALWDTLWGAEGAGARRTARMLNWRYAEHPSFRYELLELHDTGALAGFAVYRCEQVQQADVTVGRIVELVATPGAAESLIDAVCSHATARDIAMVDFFCTSRRLEANLLAQGFQRGDGGRALHMPHLFQPINRLRSEIACMIHSSAADTPERADDWYVTKGDADQDRPN